MKLISPTYLFCYVYDLMIYPAQLETFKFDYDSVLIKNKIYDPALTILQRTAGVVRSMK